MSEGAAVLLYCGLFALGLCGLVWLLIRGVLLAFWIIDHFSHND